MLREPTCIPNTIGSDSTGLLTLTGGTLTLGGAGGAIEGRIHNTTSLIFDRSTPVSSGAISGSGSVVLNGRSVVTLTGSNSYSGNTTINAGTLRAGTEGAFSPLSRIAIANDPEAGLDLNGYSQSIRHLTGGGTILLNGFDQTIAGFGFAPTQGSLFLGGAKLTIGSNNTSSIYRGTISQSGTVVKIGTGTLAVQGINQGAVVLKEGGLAVDYLFAPLLTIEGGTFLGGDILGNPLLYSDLVLKGNFGVGKSMRFEGVASLEQSITITSEEADANTTFAKAISGTGRLTIAAGPAGIGTGAITLVGDNTYTGGTQLDSGRLAISSNANLGHSAGDVTFAGGTLKLLGIVTGTRHLKIEAGGGTLESNGFDFTFGSISGTGTLSKTGTGNITLTGTSTFEGGISLQSGTLAVASSGGLRLSGGSSVDAALRIDSQLTIDHTGEIVFNKPISGTSSIHMVDGVASLRGTNTYSGGTFVSGGTLVVDGSIVGATTVQSGGTLGGSGIIHGEVAAENGGTLSPGNSPGLLTIEGNLTLNNLSTLLMEFGGTAEELYDQLDVQGLFKVGGNLNLMILNGYTPEVGDTFTIFNGDTPGFDSGSFTGITTNLGGGLSWDVSQLESHGILEITAVPEPSTWGLLGATLLLFTFFRRRRR